MTGLAALNCKLQADCEAELARTTTEGTTHRELWQQEQPHLLPLPADRFAACTERHGRVDKQSLVHFDGRILLKIRGKSYRAHRAKKLPGRSKRDAT